MLNLFNPSPDAQAAKQRVRAECLRVQQLVEDLIPPPHREGLHVNVQQIACGDPDCSPVHTVLQLTWQAGLSVPLKLPLEAKDVTAQEVAACLPNERTIADWAAGRGGKDQSLRFAIGDRVECRIGQDIVTGWASGTVLSLWHREKSWPAGTVAPYQVQLDNGSFIFAPRDLVQIIRELPPLEDPQLSGVPDVEPTGGASRT